VTKACVLGARGRMGAMLIQEATTLADELTVVSATERPDSPAIGTSVASGARITDDMAAALAAAEVYIDFTVPAATRRAAELARTTKTAAVIGTTGLTAADQAAVEALASVAPVVQAPNFSVGVNLLLMLAELAARTLGSEFDMEVLEAHHHNKRDAPSGTAIALAQALARGRGQDLDEVKRFAREGDIGPRPPGEIGVATLRGGDVVGDHTAFFFGPHERLELTHRAGSRAIFARGALRAAIWLARRPPGLYSMRDVLGAMPAIATH
jgi:4-hydroxy-tetrahydrodipicolinate reductase